MKKTKAGKNKREIIISVIVPSLDEEKYIEPTLRALRNQDYKGKYEIIVADGMSKDNTVKIAKKYADRVLVVGRGVSKGRNAGAKVAKGDLLVFIDADTLPMSNFIQTVEKTFEDRRVVAASSPVMPVKYKLKDLLGCLAINEILLKASIKVKSPIMIGNNISVRRSAFEKVGGFDERLTCLEDIDFAQRLSKVRGRFAFMEGTMVLTSTRRPEKWGGLKLVKAWPFGYIRFKLMKKVPNYEPIR